MILPNFHGATSGRNEFLSEHVRQVGREILPLSLPSLGTSLVHELLEVVENQRLGTLEPPRSLWRSKS
jgi:hypothetical protein